MSVQHTLFSLHNHQREQLAAILTTRGPPPKPLNHDLVILCHGFQGSKDSHLMQCLAEELPFTTVRIDFSGNGDSEGQFCYSNYNKEVSDLRCLILHLRDLGANITTVVGHSKGGGVVLLYAAQYGDVPWIVNLAGRYDMRRGVRERFGEENYQTLMNNGSINVRGNRNGVSFSYRVTRQDLEERFAVDMSKAVKRISDSIRVLTVHGGEDKIIPVADGHEIDACARNGELVVFEGCGHSFVGFEKEVARKISEFVGKNDL